MFIEDGIISVLVSAPSILKVLYEVFRLMAFTRSIKTHAELMDEEGIPPPMKCRSLEYE